MNNLSISLLSVLSKPELTALGKYLQSPFFTNKSFLYPLFIELRNDGQRVVEHPEAVFVKVFPKDDAFDRHKWNKALSDLNFCIENFLAVSRFQEDKTLYRQAKIQVFFERDDESLFQRALGNALDTGPGESHPEHSEFWQQRFWSRKRAYTYPLANHHKLPDSALEEMNNDLDIYYFTSKLQLACNQILRSRLRNQAYQPEPLHELLARTAAVDPLGKSALFVLYRALLSLWLSLDIQLFAGFFELLKNRSREIEQEELAALIRFGFSYCISCYRRGALQAIDHYFQLFLWSNEQQAWKEGGMAEELFLNNGVMLARNRKQELFDNFLLAGKPLIPAERSEDAAELLMAFWFFYQGNFDKVAMHLARVNTRHPRYALLMHTLRVRNSYELWTAGQFDLNLLQLALISFEEFLRRQDWLARPLQKSYHELIWFIRMMARIGRGEFLAKVGLRKEIEVRQPAARDWVASTVEKLPD